MSDLFVQSWGSGTPVVLVHGSLATSDDEWQAQRPLADEGFRLLRFDRRGYGQNATAPGEDFLRDADDIADLMGDGAHLVGHSYGGLGVLYAAARRPEATLSLTVLEPGAFMMGQDDPAARKLVTDIRRIWNQDLPDEEWRHGLHGGAVETAMMLHLRPDLVRSSEIGEARTFGQDLEESLRRLRPEGPVSFSWLADDLNRSGVVGNALRADAVKGERLVTHYGEALADAIRDARAFPLDRLA